jgi:hypothetical protein
MGMSARLKKLGVVLAILGLVFVAGGVFAYGKVKAGDDSLKAFAAAQNVTLSYDEAGQLVSGGTTEEGAAILAMLKDDWKYPVVMSELDPNDPLVNTATEYMYQMATVTYHTLHATVTITLPTNAKDAVYNGVTYHAGDTVEFVNDGRYWTGFDRNNAIEAAARGQIWSATAHALIGELGVGTVTASTLQLGLGVAALMGGIGLTSILAGLGLVWAAGGAVQTAAAPDVKVPAKAKIKK